MFPDIIPSGTKLAHSYDNKANPKGITSMSTSPQAKKYPFGTRVERKTMRRHEVIKTTLRELIIAICDRAAKRSDINPQLSDRFSQKDNNDVKQVFFRERYIGNHQALSPAQEGHPLWAGRSNGFASLLFDIAG